MSIAEFKKQVPNMTHEEREELISYLISVEEASTSEWRRKMSEILNDKDTSHWIDFDEFLKTVDLDKGR